MIMKAVFPQNVQWINIIWNILSFTCLVCNLSYYKMDNQICQKKIGSVALSGKMLVVGIV